MEHDDRLPTTIQRIENGVLAVLALVAFLYLDFAWWWLVVLFLAFDLSMIGYVRGPRLGALTYNLGHNYAGPAILLGVALVADARGAAFVGLAWAFHVAVDRALGYGLKFRDRFTHTHLGEVGKGGGTEADQGRQ